MKNAFKLRDSIQLHCEGNPFIVKTPLKNIVSSVLIPESAKEDILSSKNKGLQGYHASSLTHPTQYGIQ